MLRPNNTINSDVQKRRFALLLHAGYGNVLPDKYSKNFSLEM